MDRSYPDKYVPASRFELDGPSRGLLERMQAIPTGKLTAFNVTSYTQEVMEYISEVIGHPSQLLHEQIPQWDVMYRDLWTPVLRWYTANTDQENAELVYKSYLVTHKIMVKEGFIDRIGPEAAYQLAEKYVDAIESPWIPMFIEWDIQGRKQYVVSQGLSEKLKKTVLKGYPSKSFKLPYWSFYIDLRTYGKFGQWGLEGAIVRSVWGGEAFQIALIVDKDTGEFPRMIQIDAGFETLEEALEAAFSRGKLYKTEAEVHPELREKYKDGQIFKDVAKDWRELFSYIVNVVLYATMPDCESEFQYYDPRYEKTLKKLRKHSKGSQKHQKAKAKLGKIDRAGYDYLGGSIRVDRSVDRESSRESQETGRKLTVRSLVSGHWRDQPCGVGLKDRKRIWIEPFWRGPEGVPITQRTHSLK